MKSMVDNLVNDLMDSVFMATILWLVILPKDYGDLFPQGFIELEGNKWELGKINIEIWSSEASSLLTKS